MENYPTSFFLAFACIISCCCFSRTSSRLRDPPVNEQIHSWGQWNMLTPTLLPTAVFLRWVCQVFTNAAGADGDISHRLAQTEFLQGGKLRRRLCTTNHNKPQLENVVASIWIDWRNTTCHLLLWMSFLFFGSGGMTVNAVELKKEKHAFVCLLLSAHVRLNADSAPSWQCRAD